MGMRGNLLQNSSSYLKRLALHSDHKWRIPKSLLTIKTTPKWLKAVKIAIFFVSFILTTTVCRHKIYFLIIFFSIKTCAVITEAPKPPMFCLTATTATLATLQWECCKCHLDESSVINDWAGIFCKLNRLWHKLILSFVSTINLCVFLTIQCIGEHCCTN